MKCRHYPHAVDRELGHRDNTISYQEDVLLSQTWAQILWGKKLQVVLLLALRAWEKAVPQSCRSQVSLSLWSFICHSVPKWSHKSPCCVCSSLWRISHFTHQMHGWLPTKQNNSLCLVNQELGCIMLTTINHGSVAKKQDSWFQEKRRIMSTATLPTINYCDCQLQTITCHFFCFNVTVDAHCWC